MQLRGKAGGESLVISSGWSRTEFREVPLCQPKQRLLLKLKAHGIGDSITDWIEQWLTDRR